MPGDGKAVALRKGSEAVIVPQTGEKAHAGNGLALPTPLTHPRASRALTIRPAALRGRPEEAQ